MGLFSGYVRIGGYILHVREHAGDVVIEVVVTKNRLKGVFTGKIDPHKLKNKHVKLYIPKTETEKEVSKKELQKMKEKVKQLEKA
jgi:starvation-inducible outer membrane lipoprotein